MSVVEKVILLILLVFMCFVWITSGKIKRSVLEQCKQQIEKQRLETRKLQERIDFLTRGEVRL